MSFDKPTRNKLASMVGECRRLLTEDIRHQLQAIYGLQPDGDALDVNTLGHLDEQGREAAEELRAWQAHLASTEIGTEQQRKKEAFDRVARETAFTALNRLAALRMCEERGHVIECVRRGMESDGFLLYERFSSGVLGDRGATYRIFLERMFDELAVDLGALFDRKAPQSVIFPRERCLEEVLTLLNAPELAHLWKADETIGWIYQYFNSKEEREAMRDASSAPRNSRELAVRNQFFTPRYVVEFLVDNTLGRTWYEMRQGITVLKESCQYLVRRPTEIFLRESDEAPTQDASEGVSEGALSQEDLLKRPVYIAYRAKKDPRDLKILDPACGSGHFLLYCFDLLETIYEEAWAQEDQPGSSVTGGSLRHDYPDPARLKRDIPALIIRHNLHGIDIDLRACQIAALVLWLRAQRSYQRMQLKVIDRPRITRSNIVCAEPMPGEPEMLEQFIADLRLNVIGQLVRVVFEKMKLAGEAGSLLKIEEEIRDAVAEAKKQWLAGPKPEQQLLFGDIPRPQQVELAFDFSGITDAIVWERAEELIYKALERYAEQAENGHGYHRRLFSDDARRGFGFIDLCRQRYDVVLMNPPFGSPAEAFKDTKELYPYAGRDIYAMFVGRATLLRNSRGLIGAILPRTGLFIGTMTDLRREIYLDRAPIRVLADLGKDVLDRATIRTACYILGADFYHPPVVCLRIGNIDCRESKIIDSIAGVVAAESSEDIFLRPLTYFSMLPNSAIAYWIPETLAIKIARLEKLELLADIRQGIATGDNFRFLRLFAELPVGHRGYSYYSKGGEPVPFLSNETLYVRSASDSAEMKANAAQQYGSASRTIKNEETFGHPGITYSQVNDAGLKFRVHPPDALYDMKGPVIFVREGHNRKTILAFLNSAAVEDFMRMMTDGRQWHVTALKNLPTPSFTGSWHDELARICEDAVRLRQLDCSSDETGHYFSFGKRFSRNENSKELSVLEEKIDDLVWYGYGASSAEITSIRRQRQLFLERRLVEDAETPQTSEDLIGLLVGCVFGRWDIGVATGEKDCPQMSDPFGLLPTRSPAMLQQAEGTTSEGDIACLDNANHSRSVRISSSGILVDDSGREDDIVRLVKDAISLVWEADADEIELKACAALTAKNLRDCFRRPASFFADHLGRYSKGRQAPIYWPLSTASGSYTLWIYYHRLNDDTLYSAINKFVKPKIDATEKELGQFEADLPNKAGRDASKLRDTIEQTKQLLDELHEFRAALERAAALPYKPNLNDGVLITAAPLWKLFRLPKWRKDLQECWKKLEAGDYDWAHLAYSIWPDRVREVCKHDRSIAIAHGLEELCEVVVKPTKKKRSNKAANVAAPNVSQEETVPGDEE